MRPGRGFTALLSDPQGQIKVTGTPPSRQTIDTEIRRQGGLTCSKRAEIYRDKSDWSTLTWQTESSPRRLGPVFAPPGLPTLSTGSLPGAGRVR